MTHEIDSDSEDAMKNTAFSSTSIDSLSKRLFGEEERNTKKLVYLWVNSISSLYSVTLSRDPMVSLEASFLSKITGYGCGVLDSSKIVIAGGKRGGIASKDVFIYHTDTKTWMSLPMNFHRGEKPTVVGADNKVFVFDGGNFQYGKFWAEFYDFSDGGSGLWKFLPWPRSISKPSDSVYLFPSIVSHAVYPNGNQILLWLSNCAVLSFNYRDSSWKRFDEPMSIAVGPQWSATVVVLEDFLFWHNHGTIYAHDLLSDVTIPMYTLPRTGFSSAICSGDDDVYSPKFLVHMGRGKLCLFYLVDKCICYITFWVQISQGDGPPTPRVVVDHSGFLETPSITVANHALEISS